MEKVLKLSFSQKIFAIHESTKNQLPANCVQASTQKKKNLRVSCSSHLAKLKPPWIKKQNKTKQNKTHFVGRERARERHIVAHCCCYNGRKKDRFYQVGFWRLVITFFVCKSRFFCGKA
jgi:hypothetical protein